MMNNQTKKLKTIIKLLLYHLMSLKPFKVLRKMANRELVVVNYHSISGVDPDPVVNNNIYRTEDEFEQDIIFLKKHYHFVSLHDILSYIKLGDKLPKNSVFLTFDDGLKVIYNKIRPILLKHQVSAVFFLNPSFIDNKDLHFQRKKNLIKQSVTKEQVEGAKEHWEKIFAQVGILTLDFMEALDEVNYKKSNVLNSLADLFKIDFIQYLKEQQIYLNKSEIEQMIKEGFSFGGHSMDHPKYDELTLNEQIVQTKESITWVKEKFNLDYSVFAFPLRDHQISQKFFKAIHANCEASFGVMGMGDDIIKNHIQRIDVESTGVKISQVLKFEYAKYLIRRALGKTKFKRPL